MHIPLYDNMMMGFVAGIFAVAGDLFESLLKRCANVKVRRDYIKLKISTLGFRNLFERSWWFL